MTPAYSRYYNETRTHLSLDKDAPLDRAIQRQGAIVAAPILSVLFADTIFRRDRSAVSGVAAPQSARIR